MTNIRNESMKHAMRFALLCGAAFFAAARDSRAATPPTVTPLGSYQGIFSAPARVAVDGAGNLYVTDPRAGQLLKLNVTGQVVAVKSGLARPLAVAVGNQGTVYVSEEGAGRVSVYNSALTTNKYFLGSGSNEFLLPNHVAVDTTQSNGWAYVTDSLANQVKCYSNATLVKSFGGKGAGEGQFDFPTGVFVSQSREVFVVDQNNDRVQVFDSTGGVLSGRAFSLATSLDDSFPSGRSQGITGDGAGRVYVADTFQGEVKVFDSLGNYLSTVGSLGEKTGQFRSPTAVALDGSQRLFVASGNNRRVEIFGLASAAEQYALTVDSAHGGAYPGSVTADVGTVVSQWVTNSPVAGGVGSQYVCVGAVVAGNVYTQVSPTNVTLTLTNNASLSWQWQTQFNLTASAGANGSVAASNGWYDAGSTAVLTATGSNYYHFATWTGTVAATTNPLALLMSQSHTVVALFDPDLTTNGTPLYWLAAITNGDPNAVDLADTDGDGMANWQEWAAGTDPTNKESVLRMTLPATGAITPSGAVVQWTSVSNKFYILQRTTNLVTGFGEVVTNHIPAIPPLNATTDPSATGQRQYFYRIEVERP